MCLDRSRVGVRSSALKKEITQRLREEFPTWWLPDAIEFTDEIPKTATGKFSKRELRGRYTDISFSDQSEQGHPAPEQPE
jgi:fatty-acyl-CoA synthase